MKERIKELNAEKFFSKTATVFSMAVFCTLLWGSAFPCVKIGYKMLQITDVDMGSQMLFAGIRFLVAGFMTILVSLFLEKEEYMKRKPMKFPVGGILLVALVQTGEQYFFYYIGMAHVTGVKGAILNGSTAFFCVIIARIFYKKKEMLTASKLAGLLSAVVAALGSLANKEVSQSMGPVTLCGWQLTMGALMLIALGIVMGGNLSFGEVGTAGWLLLLYMSFISAAAFTLWTILLKYNPMGRITVYNFLIPVFGSILSALLLGEKMWNIYTLSALPLVCGGIFLVNRKK